MAINKITESDLSGKGVVGQAEVPGLPAAEMQYKVEEIVREVAIPKINEVIDEFGNVDENMESLERSVRNEVYRVQEDFDELEETFRSEVGDFRQQLAGINAEMDSIPNNYVTREDFSAVEEEVEKFPENYASKAEVKEIVSGGGHPVTSVFGRLGDISAQAGDYTAEQVGAAEKNHAHTVEQITDFPDSMPASDVYPWAKEMEKPEYTCEEIGAEREGKSEAEVGLHNASSSAHSSLFSAKQNKPVSISGSGSISVTLQDNCEYSYSGVTALSMTGTEGEAHGFVVFGNSVGNVSVSGACAGDDIKKASAKETWEFSCFKNRFIWKNWG